eukprot:scaffold661806_cov60-Prasinocladus_malaysianus.AAC.1
MDGRMNESASMPCGKELWGCLLRVAVSVEVLCQQPGGGMACDLQVLVRLCAFNNEQPQLISRPVLAG